MGKDTILKRVKKILGAPIVIVELTDELFEEAYVVAMDSYELFSNIADKKNWGDDIKIYRSC